MHRVSTADVLQMPDLRQLVRSYVSNPLFSAPNEWLIHNNQFRRPVRPQDVAIMDFATPLERDEACSSSALTAQRMLLNVYETDLMFLPDESLASNRNDFDLFYSDANKVIGEMIRPALEKHLFGFLDDVIDVSGKWTEEAMAALFDARFAAVKQEESALCRAILSAPRPGNAADCFLIQVAGDFLSEASAMARNVLGSFGPAQSSLFTVLIDEYGYGVHETKHSTLFAETMRSRGLETSLHTYWQYYLASSLALINYFHLVCKSHRNFFRYVGALYYTETTLAYATRDQSRMLREVFGEEVDTTYFDEHAHIDLHHGEMVMERIIRPILGQCGVEVIPDIIRGFEEFRLLQDIADQDLIDQIAWSQDLGAYQTKAQEMLHEIDDPRARFPHATFTEVRDELTVTHVHDDDELFVVEEGALEFVANYGESVTLQAGEAVVIPRHRLHGTQIRSDTCVYTAYAVTEAVKC